MKAIVTVKLNKNPRHDPRNKQKGRCPCSGIMGYFIYCTDTTGEHHSFIVDGFNLVEIIDKVSSKFKHITRIEVADEWEK